MKAHLIDTHLLVSRSRSSAKVTVKYQGHVSQKMGVSGALVFQKHILLLLYLQDLRAECRRFDPRLDQYFFRRLITIIGNATAFTCLSPLSIVSTMIMWESSQWLGNNIKRSTGKRTLGKHGYVHWPPRYN